MSESRPHLNRRRHQAALAKQHMRRRKRRLARIRRIRLWRTLRSLRFWSRASVLVVLLLAVSFWSKFAFVYDIPAYADRGPLAGIAAYVTVKPWWFGPPMFDLANYVSPDDLGALNQPYSLLLTRLDHYDAIVLQPNFIWVLRK